MTSIDTDVLDRIDRSINQSAQEDFKNNPAYFVTFSANEIIEIRSEIEMLIERATQAEHEKMDRLENIVLTICAFIFIVAIGLQAHRISAGDYPGGTTCSTQQRR